MYFARFLAALPVLALAPAIAQEPVSFDRQIKPILTKQCLGCHFPAGRQAGLSLSSFADFQKGGNKGPAFVAGKPEESIVIAYLNGERKPQMPFGGKPLPSDQ